MGLLKWKQAISVLLFAKPACQPLLVNRLAGRCPCSYDEASAKAFGRRIRSEKTRLFFLSLSQTGFSFFVLIHEKIK
jgi:hypothetical protein